MVTTPPYRCAKEPVSGSVQPTFFSGMSQINLEPDTGSYNATISAISRGNCLQHVSPLLDEMQSRSLEPDSHSFTAGVRACEATCQWERVLELLSELRKSGKLTTETRNEAIRVFEASDQKALALELFSDMPERETEPTASDGATVVCEA